LFIIWKEYGPKTRRLLISPNIPRVGRMQTITEILKNTGCLGILRIGNNIKRQLKTPSVCFPIKKSKKLPIRNTAYGNS